MSDDALQSDDSKAGQIPEAWVRSTADRSSGMNLTTRLWGVTAAALIVSIGLVLWNQKPAGLMITIQFEQGHGLRPGNSLQHRGIEVGEVTTVELSQDGTGVFVNVELQPQAKALARKGSQFWIVRPRVSLTRVTGLETVVGARYIEVQPGSPDAPMALAFEGLETPLSLADSDTVDIEIRFNNGDGLATGDEVRHRGIVVGEVTSVVLNASLDGVVVKVRLLESASRLARIGTQFWVERPTLSVAEVRGLDTLVGGRYIAVQPGPAGGRSTGFFSGLDKAPAGELPAGGVEVVLEASQRGGLRRGVPVLFRGQQVGHVIDVALSSDAATVEARVWVDAAYRELLRDNTKFWMNSGVELSVGLDGLKLSADTLSSIIAGGVSLATPTEPGAKVSTGHRFSCAATAEDDWLTWQARIPLGRHQVAADVPLPVPVRASLRWEEKQFGFRRDRQRSGWLLPLSDGRLLGPADLLHPVDEAIDGTTTLEAAGETVELTTDSVTRFGDLAVLKHNLAAIDADATASSEQIESPSEPVDCLIFTAGLESVLSVSASRLRPLKQDVKNPDATASEGSDAWLVHSGVPLTSDHHGASIVSRTSGKVIGILRVSEIGSQIALIPQATTWLQ